MSLIEQITAKRQEISASKADMTVKAASQSRQRPAPARPDYWSPNHFTRGQRVKYGEHGL